MDETAPLSGLSLFHRNWTPPPLPIDSTSLAALRDGLGISAEFGQILAARNLADVEEARRFLHPGEEQLHPPELMLGMEAAVERIRHGIENRDKILIIGDYDVDGAAATTILYNFLKRLGARAHYFIPHRVLDGYGLAPGTIRKFAAWKVDLVITADHGSTAVEGARLLAERGIDLIITDHHRMGAEAPDCLAMVNPHQPGCPYPFKELAATGVAYKVVCALDRHLTRLGFWERNGLCHTAPSYYLDLVALATVADTSPLIGENRILVKLGLESINRRPRPGLSGLIREANVREAISPEVISFKLAPRINSVGRVGNPLLGVQLLLSRSFTEGRRLARLMNQTNRERQKIEREVFDLAMHQVDSNDDQSVCIVVGGKWHPGVIGSIAARVAMETRKPTVVLTLWEPHRLQGSARGWGGHNVLEALEACSSLLERYGGHPSAAGLALDAANLEAFTREFRRAAGGANGHDEADPATLKIDAWISAETLTRGFLGELDRLSPFGAKNREPVVAVRGMALANASVFNSRHLKFDLVCQDGSKITGYAWNCADWEPLTSARYDVAFIPQSPSNGKPRVKVLDIAPCD